MTTDPMLAAAGTLSINRFTGDGSKTSWDFNFTGGYINQSDVKAYTTAPDGTTLVRTIAWVGPNTVSITPAVAAGYTLTLYRDTPKDVPLVDFTDGSVVNEANLDKLAEQSVFISAEMVDRFSVVNDKADAAVLTANLAKTSADIAISNTALIVGGDFTKFGRTDTAATWTAAQNFAPGTTVNGQVIATQNYVTSALASFDLSLYATKANAVHTGTITLDGAAATLRGYRAHTSGVARWGWGGNATAESGSNVGTDFYINRHDDAGTLLGTALTISRATGIMDLSVRPTVAGVQVSLVTDVPAFDPDWIYTLATR